MDASLSVNLEKMSDVANKSLYLFVGASFLLGHFFSFYFHFATVFFILLTLINFYYLYVQKEHTLLSNYGFMAQLRYIVESVGPEFRQYLFMSDTEERLFNRVERSEVYRKAKNVDSSSAFGSLKEFNDGEIKLRHSMFPVPKEEQPGFSLTFGEERGIKNQYTITKPIIISAMSYGALSANAVQAFARGAKKAGIPMNTGEGGYPKYHLMEGCDLIFQMGTAKFGVRNEDGSLNEEKLANLASKNNVKMIEIKLSQGAKPGKGGLLPKEKITEEISELRGVPMGKDVVSPPSHIECKDPKTTVAFIQKVQEVSQLPVGIKLCLGRPDELAEIFREMNIQKIYPDYISVDGAEGGTGAAPTPFIDDIGLPLYKGLSLVNDLLDEHEIRGKLKVLGAGKLINVGKQVIAMSLGADAIYTARGFMLAIGCIQALQCNKNTCPVGITTHFPHLTKGLDPELKSERVKNYVDNLYYEHKEILASLGKRTHEELCRDNLYVPNNSVFKGVLK